MTKLIKRCSKISASAQWVWSCFQVCFDEKCRLYTAIRKKWSSKHRYIFITNKYCKLDSIFLGFMVFSLIKSSLCRCCCLLFSSFTGSTFGVYLRIWSFLRFLMSLSHLQVVCVIITIDIFIVICICSIVSIWLPWLDFLANFIK